MKKSFDRYHSQPKPKSLFPREIKITDEDVANSVKGDPLRCPIATHLRRVIGQDAIVVVTGSVAIVTSGDVIEKIELDKNLSEDVRKYDETGVWSGNSHRIIIGHNSGKSGTYSR